MTADSQENDDEKFAKFLRCWMDGNILNPNKFRLPEIEDNGVVPLGENFTVHKLKEDEKEK